MKTRLKLATIALILMACSFLAGSGPTQAKAGTGKPQCQYPQTLWCYFAGEGGPWICYCSVKP